jgi:hypothetical protein
MPDHIRPDEPLTSENAALGRSRRPRQVVRSVQRSYREVEAQGRVV